MKNNEHWEEVFEVFNDDYFPNDASGEEEYRIKLKQFISNILQWARADERRLLR